GGFWEIVTRGDGSRQWVFKGSPVYTFVGDKIAGDITGNNRHVIVYGGPQGQLVYADAGGDPRDVQPLIGQNVNMGGAGGAPPPPNDVTLGGGDSAAAAAGNTPRAGGQKTGPSAATGAAAGQGQGGAAAAARRNITALQVGDASRYRGSGAGLYWHTV